MQFRTILLISLGFVFLGLGAIGLFLPIWPTTPFVLLSAACFSSSPQIKGRIMKIPFFNEHIENYEKRTGLSGKTVRISLIWLWGTLAFSIIMKKKLWFTLLLLAIGVAVSIHILLMSNAREKSEGMNYE